MTTLEKAEPMTSDELAALRRSVEQTTAGTWRQGAVGVHAFIDQSDMDDGCGRMVALFNDANGADATFIVSARNAMPRLLDEIEALRAENERLQSINADAAQAREVMK